MKNKTGAMEMSVGTIVTIVLLMSTLVLGLVLIRNIGKSSTENINAIDQKVKDQITKMFSEDDLSKVVIYPSRNIAIKKGDSESGFGLSIRNTEQSAGVFSYAITNAGGVAGSNCEIPKAKAEDLIVLWRTKTGIQIPGGDAMGEPIFVVFDIPETATPCLIGYTLTVTKIGLPSVYYETTFNLEITGR
ncbi:MAG: hypothetical protein AABY32_04850 [Nanoarchaeota archaeon]